MNRKSGFTLLEIMIVVGIIGMLAALAIPNVLHSRTVSQRTVCINGLRQIEAAKSQWALENGGTNGDAVDPSFISYIKKGDSLTCPTGSSYTVNAVGVDPACDVAGHVLR